MLPYIVKNHLLSDEIYISVKNNYKIQENLVIEWKAITIFIKN